MEILHEFKQVIDEQLHVATLPIAIQFLRKGKSVPGTAGRPKRDLGNPIRPCTAFHLVRHQGHSVVMLEEDFSTGCPGGVFIFGMHEPLQPWLEGELAHGIYTGSKEAAINMESSVFRLDTGIYQGMAMAPLAKTDFTPDLVVIYCNSKQAMRLVTASTYSDGKPLDFKMAARGLCSDGVVQPFKIGRPVVAIPCGGDRLFGVSQDNELVFTTPFDKLEGIITGLRAFEQNHMVDRLGGDTKLRKQYNRMSKLLEADMAAK